MSQTRVGDWRRADAYCTNLFHNTWVDCETGRLAGAWHPENLVYEGRRSAVSEQINIPSGNTTRPCTPFPTRVDMGLPPLRHDDRITWIHDHGDPCGAWDGFLEKLKALLGRFPGHGHQSV